MEKCDAPSACSEPGRLVDQLVAGGAAALQGGVEIGDAVTDVMDARPALRQEFGDGAGGIPRFEQLDVDRAEVQADDRGAISGFRASGRESQNVAIEGKDLGDARDRDADVSDGRVHST